MDSTIESAYSYNLRKHKDDGDIPLYTKREWVGLTDEETEDLLSMFFTGDEQIKAIEAKLKEKNT